MASSPLPAVPPAPPTPSIEPIKLLAQVIQTGMGLPSGQIMLGLENFLIPKNTGLYVALLYGPDEVVGNVNDNSVDSEGNYLEVQSTAMLHHVDVDVMSFDSSARLQKEQVLWAIKSYQAQQAMEKYQMRIASTPSAFLPIQTLEETKQLNRFRITVAVYALHSNTIQTPYYSQLQTVQLVENP
jgi:hypothetical protein